MNQIILAPRDPLFSLDWSLLSKYGEILQMFHDLVKGEKSARVRDNICASTARILNAGHSQLPVQEVCSNRNPDTSHCGHNFPHSS